MSDRQNQLFKFIVIGDCGVGKTALQTQFTEGRFQQSMATIGVEFAMRTVTLRGPVTGDSVTARLQIWDTAGQERFRTITRSYYRGATGVLIVFDITQRRTFDDVLAWLHVAQEHATQQIPMTVTLVGNKTDLEEKREVPQEEAEDFAKAHDLQYIETSAKTRCNVDEAFTATARGVLKKIEAGELDWDLLPGRRSHHEQQAQPAYRGGCMC